jgi:predicted kinase
MRKLAIVAASLAAVALAACGDTHPTTTQVAATVNGAAISVQSYDAAVQSLRGRLEQHTGHALNLAVAADARQLTRVEASGLQALVAQAVIEQLAAARHVSVGDADVDAALQRLQSTAGGADQLIAQLGSSGLSDSGTRAAIHQLLLQQRLRAADPTGWDSAFATAVRDAHVSVYAAPCTAQHAYPACVQGL